MKPARLGAIVAAFFGALAIGLPLSAQPSLDGADEPPPRIEVRGANVHAAARLVAAVHGVGAWVVAPRGPALRVVLEGDAAHAFDALARRSGLSVEAARDIQGPVFLLGDPIRLARYRNASLRGLSGGRRIDLDHELVDVRELTRALGAASHMAVRSDLTGYVTVYRREARSTRAIEHLARLADARVSSGRHAISMSLGELPVEVPRYRACPPGPSGALSCADADELTLVGLAPGWALIAAPDTRAALLRAGERVGRAGACAVSIGEDGVRLRDGLAQDACAAAADERDPEGDRVLTFR
ncbi:MAG: hypothetical protein AB7S26_32620 [Sandaracinaceae bacterium]